MFENNSKTSPGDLGEFGLIERLTSGAEQKNPDLLQGIGDDAAVYRSEDGKLEVINTEIFVENVNFDLIFSPLKHLGYKMVVATISDIYAMNARPRFLTVGIAASSKYTLEALEELYSGIYLALEHYNMDLAGGDTNTSPKGLVVSMTATGTVAPDKLVRRSGCQPNDLLCVSGDLGGAYMGLQLLVREKKIFLEHPDMQPDLEGFDYIVSRQLKPEARKDITELLENLDILPTSMIDLSDGLASDLKHLAKHSGTGFVVYEEKLPVDTQTLQMAIDFNLDATTCALNGGEDYELLFTIKQDDYNKIKNNMDITVIGHATDQKEVCQLVNKSGQVFSIKAQGWPEQKDTGQI